MKQTDNKDDSAFLSKLRHSWGTPKLTPTEAAIFDIELRGKIEQGSGRRRFAFATAGFAAAAAVLVIVMAAPRHTVAPQAGAPLSETLAQAEEAAYGNSTTWDAAEQDADKAISTWPDDYDPDKSLDALLSDEYRTLALFVAPGRS